MKRIKDIALLVVLMMVAITSWSQDWKRTQNWYFGDSAGLSFATDPPTALNDGVMDTAKGCATISDTAGTLLFYTDGVTVWNKNHVAMDNGIGLTGSKMSTQSSLVVPWPDNDSLYYIFTTDAVGGPNGFQYSVVNMNENGGMGKVIIKNQKLLDRVCEKLTATHHENGKDIWVLTHGFPNDSFYAYLVTSRGLVTLPVISKTGSVHGIKDQFNQISHTDAQGAMKFNVQGDILAVTVSGLNKIELCLFDNSSGFVFYRLSVLNIPKPYSVEFSYDSKFLYTTNLGFTLEQYNLKYLNTQLITASREILFDYSPYIAKGIFHSVQIGLNNKIYVSKHISVNGTDDIGEIQLPDTVFPACNFSVDAIDINRSALYGLPNFVTSYFNRNKKKLRYSLNCNDYSGNFSGYSEGPVNSWRWEFKNATGVIIGTSSSRDTIFVFPNIGVYEVQMIADSDTITQLVSIARIKLGNDTVLCNSGILLSVLPEYRGLQWQDSSSKAEYYVTESGKYYVSGYSSNGCLLSDTIRIHIHANTPKPIITQNDDTLYTDKGYTYRWFYEGNPITGNSQFLKVNQNGIYNVEITDSNGCTRLSDDFTVTGIWVRLVEQNIFKIYPNPSEEGSEAFISGDEWITDIKVFDMSGKPIYQDKNIDAFEYKLIPLKRGVYLVRINQTFNYKIIVN